MSILSPQTPKELQIIDDFPSYVMGFLRREAPIAEIRVAGENIDRADFYKMELQKSVVEDCAFYKCDFERAAFIDVVFDSCDFSNSNFPGAYFERCTFISCKCLGVDMNDTVIKQTTFAQSNFRYAHFNKAKMTNVFFDTVDLTEASMAEAKLKNFAAANSSFIKNNYFKTMLAGIDFTNNEFVAPTVSNPPVELQGVIVDPTQAANLVSLWGIVVQR